MSAESMGGSSSSGSAESTYIHSGESTKTIVSFNEKTNTMKAGDLADRLEELSSKLGKKSRNFFYSFSLKILNHISVLDLSM